MHPTMTDGERTARSGIGPVPATAARAWLGTARRTIVRLRDDAGLGIPADVVEDFAGLVDLWERALPDAPPEGGDHRDPEAEPVFEWSGELPVERVRRLASHWAQVALLARDSTSGIEAPPPEAAPFYDALVVAIATAVRDAPDPDHFAETFVDVVPEFDPQRTSGPRHTTATATAPRRVLVVDDTDDIRLLMRLGLTRSGALDVCGEAKDGAEALRRCDELHPEAVLLDVAMPVMDGLAALERMREHHPAMRVVMFSAALDPAVRARATELGAHAFLAKDASIDDIERALLGAD